MNNRLIITDSPFEENLDKKVSVFFWNKGLKKKKEIDILDYIEKNSKKFRERYTSFIHRVKNKKIRVRLKNLTLKDYLTVNNFDSFNYSTINEKCNWAKSFYINEIIKCYAVDDIINKFKPSLVEIKLKRKNRTIKILESILKKYKLKYKLIPSVKKESSILNRIFIKKIFKAIIRYFILIIKNYKFLNNRSKKWFSLKSDLLFLSYINDEDIKNIKAGSNTSSYWGNISRYFNSKQKISWIYFGTAGENFLDKINLQNLIFKKNKKKNEMHISFYDFLTFKNIFLSIYIWLKIIFRLQKIKNIDQIFFDDQFKINNMSHLKSDFISSFYSLDMIHNILIHLTIDRILSKINKQKKCFYLFERAPWEQSLLKYLRKYNHGQIFAVGHSTISLWDMRYSYKAHSKINEQNENPDFFIANSKDMKNKIINLNNKNKVILAEALRYSYIKKIKIKKNNMDIKNFKLLVILDINLKTSLKQIRIIEKLINDFKNINIVIKTHPTSNIEKILTKKIRKMCTSKSLKNLFNDCNAVLTSNITSANFEAAHLQLPIFCYDEPESFNLSPILDKKIINFFNNYLDLKKLILKRNFPKYKINSKNFVFNLNRKNKMWQKIIRYN